MYKRQVYDIIIWNNPVDYYGIVVEYESLNDDYIDTGNIMNLNKNETCMGNVRLIFDDGG